MCMEWNRTSKALSQVAVDAVILFVTDTLHLSKEGKLIDLRLNHYLSQLMDSEEITGRFEECMLLHTRGEIAAQKIVLVGLGNEKKWSPQRFRQCVAIGARKAQQSGVKELAISVPEFLEKHFGSADLVQAVVEGVELGCYELPNYKQTSRNTSIKKVVFSEQTLSKTSIEAGMERGRVFAEASKKASTWCHEPANYLTPTVLANYADEVAKRCGLEIDIVDKDRLEELNAHAFLAVAKGSAQPPKLIMLRYQGAPDDKEVLGLVGKGVTFDSGGLQIKPHEGMDQMKSDMSGAAAVLAAMDAIGTLKPHCNVVAVIVSCENMTGSHAYRPGDVLRAMSGKTIEVTHTDAEGRLILADGLAYARQLGATKLVDIATLTGAALVCLGREKALMLGNDDTLLQDVFVAAGLAGEPVWKFPLEEEYDHYLHSDIADVKNEGGRAAGAIQGGVFLQHFVEDTPWVHLDIAGPAFSQKDSGIYRKGATGAGTRTLIHLALQMGL
ncbi:leucyl aminopeptidase [Thermoactinomyces sp. DSM 45891]|nr:leucyl aminopeptidase [Thermoactinomyces sp. DSM 45891]